MRPASEMSLRPPVADAARGGGAACAHCGLPVPAGLIDPRAARQFCCHACETVWGVIHGCGLERYYRLRDNEPRARVASPARTTGNAYESFDDPAFQALYTKEAGGGSGGAGVGGGPRRVTLQLEGVHCGACVWLLERLPSAAAGVIESRLDLRRATLELVWDPRVTSLSRVARFIDSLGYPAHPARAGGLAEARKREDRAQLIRIGVAGAIAGNVMLLAFALYSRVLEGAAMEAAYAEYFRWLSAGLAVLALAWPGSVFFRGAWTSLRHARRPSMDVPIAVGLAVGGAWGLVNIVRGSGEIYFDTVTMLIFLLLCGRWLQSRQQRRAADALELLFSLTPTTARLVEAAGVREVPVEALRGAESEAIIEVLPGGSIPVDGVVIDGSSDVDQSLLTGESRPVGVHPGEAVCAGAVNLTAPIRLRLTASGEATRVGRLMRLVEEGTRRRAPIVRLADRVAGVFVWAVLGLAAVTAGIWAFLDPAHAVDHAAALLISTCPCALGLATPLAVVAAVGRAARRGILVKGGDALESLASRGGGVLILDKTGTITESRTAVVQWDGPAWLKPIVAAAERRCVHPVARALSALHAEDAPVGAIDVRHALGGGVEARVDGREVVVGSPRFVRERLGGLPGEWEDRVAAAAARGLTPVVVAYDGRAMALAGIGDPVRAEARGAIARLASCGWDVRIVSGDHAAIVRAVGAELGLPADRCAGEASPEDKLSIVRELIALSGGRPVVMVGDGVNDAAALSAATVGVAVHGGAEASLAAADIYLSRPGLAPLVELVGGSRRTLGAIRLGMRASLAYNLVCTALAMSGLLTPLFAAVLMPLSSFTVILLAGRARTFDGREEGAACR